MSASNTSSFKCVEIMCYKLWNKPSKIVNYLV